MNLSAQDLHRTCPHGTASIPFVELVRVFRQAGHDRGPSAVFDSIVNLTVVRVLREYGWGSDSEEDGHRLWSFGGLLSFADGNSEFGVSDGTQNEGRFCAEAFCHAVRILSLDIVI